MKLRSTHRQPHMRMEAQYFCLLYRTSIKRISGSISLKMFGKYQIHAEELQTISDKLTSSSVYF